MRRIFLKNRFIYRENDVYFVKLIKFLKYRTELKAERKNKKKSKEISRNWEENFFKNTRQRRIQKKLLRRKTILLNRSADVFKIQKKQRIFFTIFIL